MVAEARVLVVQHELGTGPGWVGDWLVGAGLSLQVCHPYTGEAVPRLATYDAALVLGGAMGPAEDERCPWLPEVRARMAQAVDDRVPMLGICLGAELLSLACGGQVRRGTAGPELGVLTIELEPGAGDDPLCAALPPEAAVVQWHWEEVNVLPPGAVSLARSSRYAHQLFRVGAAAWGVQGHPEVTGDIAAGWAREDSPLLSAAGRRPHELVAEVRAREPELAATWAPFAAAFAEVVREHAASALDH